MQLIRRMKLLNEIFTFHVVANSGPVNKGFLANSATCVEKPQGSSSAMQEAAPTLEFHLIGGNRSNKSS